MPRAESIKTEEAAATAPGNVEHHRLQIGLAWAIGLAPVILILVTWATTLSPAQKFTRSYALPVLAVEISIILLSLCEWPGFRKPRPQVALPFVALMVLVWFSALSADHSDASILHTSIWMIHIAYGFSIFHLFSGQEIEYKRIIHPLMVGYLIFLLLFIVFVVSNLDQNIEWSRQIPAFNNIRWFGYYSAAITGLGAWGWINGKPNHFAIATLALAAALWTGSRGPFFAVAAGYLAASCIFPFARRGFPRFIFLLVVAGAVAALATWIAPIGDYGPQRLLGADGNNGRVDAWRMAIHAIAQRPWLGWGEAQFNYLVRPLLHTHPHNVVLQILLAWGLIGCALIAWLSALLARKILASANEENAPLLIAALNIAALSMIDGSLYHVQSTSLFVLCVSILAASPAQWGGGIFAGRERPIW